MMINDNNIDSGLMNPEDKVRISILNSLENLNEAIEAYNRKKFNGYETDIYEVRTRILTLFNKIKPMISEDYDSNVIENVILSDDSSDDDVIRVYHFINQWLYSKKLTNVFKRRVIL